MKRNKKTCSVCHSDVSLSNYKRHVNSCKEVKRKEYGEEYGLLSNGSCKCNFCDKVFTKKGIDTHIWRKHGEGKTHNPNIGFSEGRIIWNKGLTSDSDIRVKKLGETLSKTIKRRIREGTWKIRKMSPSAIEKLSIRQSKHNTGGKSKWFNFQKKDGTIVKVQGTYELRFAKVLEELDSEWTRGQILEWFDGDGKKKRYSADFYSPLLGKNFELKGHWWGKDEEKMKRVIKQNPGVVIEIVWLSDLKEYEKLLTKGEER